MLDFTRTDNFIKLLIFGQGIVYKGTIFISLSYWYWIGSILTIRLMGHQTNGLGLMLG